MEEKTIMTGKIKNSTLLCMIIGMVGAVPLIIHIFVLGFDFSMYEWAEIPLAIILIPLAILLRVQWSNIKVTVTDKRVYGTAMWGKRVDLPLDSITAVGTGLFSSLAVTTASGAIKFAMLENRDELHKTISDLLIERQDKAPAQTVIVQKQEPKAEPQKDTAEELKKYKELLDSGIITEEEFTAKKKQLLGL